MGWKHSDAFSAILSIHFGKNKKILKLNVPAVLFSEFVGFFLKMVEFQTKQICPASQNLPNKNIEGSSSRIFFVGMPATMRGDSKMTKKKVSIVIKLWRFLRICQSDRVRRK